MNLIIQNNKNLPKSVSTRFAIIPLKKHLAKFISINWNKITYSNISYIWERQTISRLKLFEIFFGELFSEVYEVSILQFSSKKYLNSNFQNFIDNNYKIIQFKFLVSIEPIIIDPINKVSLHEFTKLLNDSLDRQFYAFIDNMEGKTIESKIKHTYFVFKLDETDIKKSTLKRTYHLLRENEPFNFSKPFKNTFYPHIPDRIIILYYSQFLDGKITLKQIADELNISKSTLKNIFNNPAIQTML